MTLSVARTMQNTKKTTLGSTQQGYFQQSSQRQVHQEDQQEHVYQVNFIAQLPDNTPILQSIMPYYWIPPGECFHGQLTNIVTSAMTAASLEEFKPELYASDIKFKCPSCHELMEHEVKCRLLPYHPFVQNIKGEFSQVLDAPTTLVGICERASKAQVCADLILILHLMCIGMEVHGSLPKLLHLTLKEYHMANSLMYKEVTFDFRTERKLDHWTKRVELLCARLKGQNFGCKIIFIMVHSIVTHSDMFAGKDKDGNVAMTVEDFMSYLFILPLIEVVYRSTLFMLTCSHVVSLQPEYTILFTAPELIVAATKLFTMAYSIQVLIHGHSFLNIFHDLLSISLNLRVHTDVLIFYISSLLAPKALFSLRAPALDVAQPPSIIGGQYLWYHSHQHPWGKALPMGCSSFKVYSEPLPMEHEILQDSKISGWIKYTIWCTGVLCDQLIHP
ncbi:hypothetical protein EDD17DRAFT_1511157 [Pisolithus thermaeus]|nr:hypothetical protein EDD17DRAFT_1511157 [Pisolithus thermaeus]